MDIHHILAQNREDGPQEKELSALDAPPRPPVMGILTQTLIQSPVIKWIIPARIRHESKNDVLFIHDTFIEIKEIEEGSRDGQMRTVAVKMDFDSSIQSARVFGLPRRYTNPLPEGQDVIIKAEQMEGVELFTPPQSELPPHILVLALESKKLVFLVSYHDKDDHICFISYERPLPVHQPGPDQPGEYVAITPKHIAVDPQYVYNLLLRKRSS